MHNVIQLFLAANNILLMHKWNHACSLLVYVISVYYSWKAARVNHFPKILFIKKQTKWWNDKTIIELGYRKISWFVSVSQIDYLPQPSASANNWSTDKWRYFAQPRSRIAKYFFSNYVYKHILVFFTTALSPNISSTHYWHTSQVIIIYTLKIAWARCD